MGTRALPGLNGSVADRAVCRQGQETFRDDLAEGAPAPASKFSADLDPRELIKRDILDQVVELVVRIDEEDGGRFRK